MKRSMFVLIAFLPLLLFSCIDTPTYTKDVKYEVTGTATAVDLTIENDNGGTSQYSDQATPWTYSFTGYPGDFIYVSAQNQGDSGTVTATIYIDGEVYKTSTSDGAYVIATASGSIPSGAF